jgi:hypothetical protein
MSHLSHDELLAAAEGEAAPREHLEACASCRAEVEALAAVLREAASAEVPEPSPLFWQHFQARVTAAVNEEPVGFWRLWPAWRVVVPALAVLVLIVLAGRLRSPVTAPQEAPNRQAGAVAVATPAAPVEDVVGDDESWRVFSALASEADPAGSGFGTPAPGGADDAVLQMTDAERGELIRLLKAELARGAGRSAG